MADRLPDRDLTPSGWICRRSCGLRATVSMGASTSRPASISGASSRFSPSGRAVSRTRYRRCSSFRSPSSSIRFRFPPRNARRSWPRRTPPRRCGPWPSSHRTSGARTCATMRSSRHDWRCVIWTATNRSGSVPGTWSWTAEMHSPPRASKPLVRTP